MHEHEPRDEVAVLDLMAALGRARVVAGVEPDRRDDVTHIWVADPGAVMPLHVAPAPTTAQLRELVAGGASTGFVVADRLGMRQRSVLEAAGWSWWDRRGSLQLNNRGVVAELATPNVPPPVQRRPEAFARQSGRSIGLELLRVPLGGRSVRALATAAGVSVGAAGKAIAELRDAGLIGEGNVPVLPELFEELARSWRPRWYGISADVGPVEDESLGRVLRMGTDVREGRLPGWAVVSRHALPAFAQDVDLEPGPLRLLVTDERALAWALDEWGVSGAATVQIAAPPAPGAVLGRRPWGAYPGTVPWRLAEPLVLALTLASSAERADRAAVRSWTDLPGGVPVRIW